MNNCKQIFKYLAPNVWWICLCLQLAAWILSGWDIYTGIYRVSSPFSLGKGQWAILTLFFMDFLVYAATVCFRKKKIFSYIPLCLRYGVKSAHVRQSTTGRSDAVSSF